MEAKYQLSLLTTVQVDGKPLHVYGKAEDPVFLARQVLIEILGYSQLDNNYFYKENKNDITFVKREITAQDKRRGGYFD